jgi:4-amino-4-deoxy-L-arabinose transferase-like glycosyltransferase
MNTTTRTVLLLTGLWLLLIGVSFATRGYFPVDETRYVSVAWEMWLRGDYLVPLLNDLPYSQKPPLLFWLFQSGWWLFGVNDWWPRLVPELVTLANLFLTLALARRLWPTLRDSALLAPQILFGCILWTAFFTATMFDMLVVFCTLLGMIGTLQAAAGRVRGWLLLGLAIGLGVLAKGPVILLHTLPAALLAPLWMERTSPPRWGRWYLGVLGALLLGAVIALSWALPAASRGGSHYAHAIFWGQTVNRVGGELAPHRRPFWWYLPMLPIILFPWSVWTPLWRGVQQLKREGLDRGARFCASWALPVLLVFSLIKGKQTQYLLPLFPAAALLAARALHAVSTIAPRRDIRIPAIVLIAAGIALGIVHGIAHRFDESAWLEQLSPLWGVVLSGLGVALLSRPPRTLSGGVLGLLMSSVAMVIIVHLGIIRVAMPAYDLRPISEAIARAQQAGLPIAHVGKYNGQFQFLGRLRQPLDLIEPESIESWANSHPDGRIVVYYRKWHAEQAGHAEYAQAYRGLGVVLWSCAALRAHPEWARQWPTYNP